MNLSDKIVIYRTADGQTAIKVKLEDDTVWLSANQMAALFERDEKTVSRRLGQDGQGMLMPSIRWTSTIISSWR